MQQVHLFISGFVQGVGYRAFVKNKAKKLELSGWVRNLKDERVEILAQGAENTLKEFVEICEKGPFLSEVKDVSIEWQDPEEEFVSFEKLPTI